MTEPILVNDVLSKEDYDRLLVEVKNPKSFGTEFLAYFFIYYFIANFTAARSRFTCELSSFS